MKREWINFTLDISLFLTGITLAISSLLLWVVLPKGYSQQWLLWIAIHKWSGFALVVESFLHIVLHWRWLVVMTKKMFGRGKNSQCDNADC